MNLENYLESRFDVPCLIEIGFFEKNATYEEMASRICNFFGLKSIYMYDFIGSSLEVNIRANPGVFSLN